MENPMRDVIEMLKDKAQREGKMQTTFPKEEKALKQIANTAYDTYRNARGADARNVAHAAYLQAQEAWQKARKERDRA